MSALLTTDYLAAEALTICKAAGLRPSETEIEVSIVLHRDKRERFDLTVWDTNASRNPLDCHTALVMAPTAERALGGLAEKLGTGWPIAFATADQVQEATRLLNHPLFSRTEKEAFLAELPYWATAYAAQRLAALRQEGIDRASKPYQQVGEAYTVRALAA